MPSFIAEDGHRISYLSLGEGEPLILVPGGPGRDAAYLEDLGGLAPGTGRRLVILEPRGTGGSRREGSSLQAGAPAERIAADIEGLRRRLGLETFDLVGHSAGCAVAYLYAVDHQDRLRRLVLLTPSGRMIGVEPSQQESERQVERRRDAPWYEQAREALDLVATTGWTDTLREATYPLYYGPWTRAARAHAAAQESQLNRTAMDTFWSGPTDRDALRGRLASVTTPVHVVVGEFDLVSGPDSGPRIAELFPDAQLHVLTGMSHYPWIDDPDAFVACMRGILTAAES